MDTPLRAARRRRRFSLAKVADAVEVSIPHLSMVETQKVGSSPGLAARLVDFLGDDVITEEQILYPDRFMAGAAA